MRPEVLVFDYGGVMTTTSTPFRVKPIVEREGLPWQAVVTAFETRRRAYDIGDITLQEFYRRAWSDAGVSPSEAVLVEMAREDSASFLYRNEKTLSWMKDLKARGFRLAILTNMPPDLAPLFKKHFSDFISLAEVTVISSEVRLVKPMRAIYDLVREKMGVPAGALCFFDDSATNCRGAEEAGWQSVRFTDVNQAQAALDRLMVS